MTTKSIEYYERSAGGRVRILTREEEYVFARCWLRRWMAGEPVSSSPPDGFFACYPGTALKLSELEKARADKLAELMRMYRNDLPEDDRAFLAMPVTFRMVEGDEGLEYQPLDVEGRLSGS